MAEQSCKTCGHLDVRPDKRGVIVVRDVGYRCDAPLPEMRLPASVTAGHGFRWPPSRSWVTPKMGTACPCWVERVKPAKPHAAQG